MPARKGTRLLPRSIRPAVTPPDGGPDAYPEVTMPASDTRAIAMLPVRVPAGVLDGAVVELQVVDDAIVVADIRIPGPAAQ